MNVSVNTVAVLCWRAIQIQLQVANTDGNYANCSQTHTQANKYKHATSKRT